MKIKKDEIRKNIYDSKKYKIEVKASQNPLNKDSESLRQEIKTRVTRLSKQIDSISKKRCNRYEKLLSSFITSISCEDLSKYVFFPSAKHSIPPKGGMENVVRRNMNVDLKNFQEIQYRYFDDFNLNDDNEIFIPSNEDEFIQFLSKNLESATNTFYKHHLSFTIDYYKNIRCKLKNPIFIKEVFPPKTTFLQNIYNDSLNNYLHLTQYIQSRDFDSSLYIFSPYDLYLDLMLNSATEICYKFCSHIDLICFNTPELLIKFINEFSVIKNNIEKKISYFNHEKIDDNRPYTHLEALNTIIDRNLIFEKLSFLYTDIKPYKNNFKKITSKKEKNKYIQFYDYYYYGTSSKISKTFNDNLNHIKEFIKKYPFDNIKHENDKVPYINLFIQKNEEFLEKILCYEFYILDTEHTHHKIHKNEISTLSTMNLIKTINSILNNDTNSYDFFVIEEKDFISNENNTVKYALLLLFTEKIRRGFYRETKKFKQYKYSFKLRKKLNYLLAEIFTIKDFEVKSMLISELNTELNNIFLKYYISHRILK